MPPRLVTLVLALALLVGCSTDPEPQFADPTSDPPASSSTPSPSPSPSTSTSTTASATPEPKPESAKAFIRRWHVVQDEMQATGDPAEFETLNRNCQPCDEFASAVTGYYSAGGFIEFGGSEIVSINESGSSGAIREFTVVRMSGSTRFKESSSDDVQRLPGGREDLLFRMAAAGPSWVVLDYSRLS